MAPKSSSASAATRKKHAKKSQPQTTKPDPDVPSTANGPKQKKDKKAPKVKRFIPPPTYTGELDPVDIFKIGLHGSPVKPERAVILRKVGKKDPVTIERGLDEWINWINATFNTNSTNLKTDNHRQLHPSEPAELLATVPVLIHHFHRLVVHPSRRVRVLVLTLLDTLISFQYDGDRPCRMALLNPVELEKPEYIGSWIISLWDPDKTARTIANKIWNEIVDLTLEDSALVDGKFKLSDYDSEILHHLFNYIQPSQEGDSQELGTSQTIPRKIAVLSESSESTSCRLRASSFEALAHLLQIHPTPEKMFDQVIHSSIGQRETWELLTPNKIQEPLVRRAIWTLIHTLTSRQVCRRECFSSLLDTLLPVFSFLAVDAAFTERNFSVQGTMIIALVGLFKIYPALWWATNQSTSTQSLTAGNEAEDSVRVENGSSSFRHSIIEKFYAFLELGCASNPTLLYPALILIVASFPVTVENANHFFAHFWVALESRALRSSGVQGLNEFYSAWSECLLFFGKKLDDQANPLLQDQLDKIWPQLNDFDHQTDAGFNASSSAIIKVMHQSSFASQYAWSHIGTTVQAEEDERKVLRYLQFLSKARISHPQESPGIKSREASVVLCQRILNHLNSLVEVTDQAAWIPVLTSILKEESAGRTLLESSSIDLLAAFCRDRLPGAVWGGSKPHYNLFLEVLQTAAEGLASPAWIAVMDLDKFSTELTPIKHSILCGILKCAVKSDVNLPTLELDRFVLEYLEQYLEGNLRFQDIIEVILTRPKILIQDETVGRMLSVVVNELHAQTRLLLHSPHPSTQSKLQTVLPMCNLQLKHLDGLSATQQYSILSTLKQCAVDLFSVKSLLPLFGDESVKDLVGIAHEGYSLALQKYPATDLPELHRAIFIILCDCVTDVQCRIHPFDLVEILRDFLGQQHCELDVKDFLRMVPIGDINDNTLASLFSPRKFPPLLPVINCLIHDFPYGEIEVDISLTNKYDRIALAILDLFAQDRQLAQVHLWLWGHCMYIGELARYSSGSSIGGQDHRLSQDELDSIVHAVETTTTYLVSSLSVNVTPTWHGDLVIKMDKPENHIASETDPLKALILSLAIDSRREFIKDLATVALHKVLSTLFKYSDTSANDLKKWQTFLQQIQSSHSNLCLSLIRSLKPYLFTDESFQKYQNRLAAKLTDVPSTQAKTEGLHLIQLLCATAPPPDSAHIFLPQQRAVFLLQAVSGWLSSDDELGHEVNLKLLELYSDLAPIVQTVMGAHWDQMVDLIEINLEEASWEDEDSLLLVWQSCLLIKTLQSIMKHNIALKNYIGPQVQGLLKLVLDLFCSAPLRSTMTATIAPILHVIEDVLNDDEAQSLYSEVPISSLVNSIYSPSIRSSILALTIAQTAVKHLVNNLAVEIELIPESAISPLPEELLNAIQASKYQHPTATLMGWLLVFSYFHNASSRMRNSYSSQLREANLVSENLIPLLHAVLQVAERGKPINISIWDVPSFDFSLLESAMLKPIPLAAYVYFLALRTIPSQIRSWWEDCRNKQLSITVVSFISRQFSPILISHELGKFKEPATLQSLTDENMSIKVSSVIKEVKVTYTVDEESMEIVIRIPSDYPLQPVEVLDIRKVGIPDTTWRAWLLVVQQSIVNHNGSIADAIGLFKKNISLHFEGVEACATEFTEKFCVISKLPSIVCYAIISVVDRSLPSKACRTCRNRFHPSCLYKVNLENGFQPAMARLAHYVDHSFEARQMSTKLYADVLFCPFRSFSSRTGKIMKLTTCYQDRPRCLLMSRTCSNVRFSLRDAGCLSRAGCYKSPLVPVCQGFGRIDCLAGLK
ncbi:hypothetical protein VP01_904g2 [Puccinia sorghi]|uniref:E3 ubiquitin-protein ligase listerin n=1 Tax=Puccinia sorghi TaxID=27349 RepID=A0A0L6U8C7_9BASI|nr:hypothetical protein VP01_904g2 [Puccinia sorghi]